MTLQEGGYIAILRGARHDALRHAKTWMEVVQRLEKQIEEYYETAESFDVTLGGVTSRSHLGEGRQGDHLPRDGERKQPVRDYRGRETSDQGSLRQ